jgi:hypothetical protein
MARKSCTSNFPFFPLFDTILKGVDYIARRSASRRWIVIQHCPREALQRARPLFYHYAMRVIGEIAHPECKITLYHWNNRYIVKLEQGPLEQTFKIQEYDLASESAIRQVVSEDFIQAALRRFEEMGQSVHEAITKI